LVIEVNMFRKLHLILLLTSIGLAHAECYNRTAITNQNTIKITSITNIQRTVVPMPKNQNKCIVNFRAQVNDTWLTIEGENIGINTDSLDQLCAGAISYGRSQILNKLGGNNINVEQDMICTDQPIPKIHKVEIGDHILESELSPHPNFPNQFKYRSATCRWFIETEGRIGDLIQRQGVACRIQDNDWQVVDKW